MDDSILAEQIAFYRAAASDYAYERVDPGFDLVGLDELLTAIDAFRPTGDVLELACGTGVCMACVLPVIDDDGVTHMVRCCVDGPVFRGERVRWGDIGTIPLDAVGAPRAAAAP